MIYGYIGKHIDINSSNISNLAHTKIYILATCRHEARKWKEIWKK